MATTTAKQISYRERLLPGPGLFVACAMLIPAVALVCLPINARIAIPAGVLVYALVMLLLIGLSPVIEVRGDNFTAGRARIPVRLLGEIEALGKEELREALGPGSDARAYFVVRGWIHRGIKVAVNDPVDPAPYWVVTCRKPKTLAAAIQQAQTADK